MSQKKGMKGLTRRPNSNRHLAKRLKRLNRLSLCEYSEKEIVHIFKMPGFGDIYFDVHVLHATDTNFVYRAVINKGEDPFNSINRIKYNPSPSCVSIY